MHFYSVSYEGMMGLPIKMFWLMNRSIDRIMAQKDVRALTVAVCGQSQEASTAHRDQLMLEIGEVVKLEENPLKATRDEQGFNALREMANQM